MNKKYTEIIKKNTLSFGLVIMLFATVVMLQKNTDAVFALELIDEDPGIENDPSGEDFDLEEETNDSSADTDESADKSADKDTDESIAVLSIKNATVSTISNKVYTGKKIKPSPTVELNGVKLEKNTDYKLTYSSNKNTGIATIRITGIGRYAGEKTVIFRIIPAKTKINKVVSSKKKTIIVKWTKNGGKVSGYQIVYSRYKSLKKATRITVASSKKVKKIKRLKSGKTYYVRIRAYKIIGSKKVYGKYSKKIKVIVK